MTKELHSSTLKLLDYRAGTSEPDFMVPDLVLEAGRDRQMHRDMKRRKNSFLLLNFKAVPLMTLLINRIRS